MNQNHLSLVSATGDPGFFDAFKRVARAGLGFVPGGSTVLQGIDMVQNRFAGPGPALPGTGMVPRPSGGTMPILNVPGVRGTLQRAFPGGSTGLMVANQALAPFTAGAALSTGDGCPKGFHRNKSSYWTAAGFVPRGAKCVRNRSRNPANGRAAKRAVSRLKSFDRLARSVEKQLKTISKRKR